MAVLALAVALPAFAQEGDQVFYRAVGPVGGPEGGPPPDHLMVLGAEEGFELKTVKGAPYQAEAVTEVIQTLGDGNRISRKHTSVVARDGEGRVRREGPGGIAFGPLASSEGPKVVFIHDPSGKDSYVLEMDQKVARKLPPRPDFDDRRRGDRDDDRSDKAEAKGDKEKIKVEKGVKVVRKMEWTEKGDVKKEDLGTQQIEGVAAKGTRTTLTIPAGEIGNERPIEIVNERWFSDELQTIVQSRRSDPRMGETVYRLTNIQKGEPDAALFQVPDDFKVEEGGGPFFHRRIKIKEKSE
jgi:hypothetical protein